VMPSEVGEVTPEWLTGVLRADGALAADDTVTGVAAEQIAAGTGFLSDLHRLRLEGDGPESLILKLPAASALYRATAQGANAYQREVVFYRDLATACPLRTPHAYHAEFEESGAMVLLLEDLGLLEAPDHLEGLQIDRADLVLERLAAFHAWGVSAKCPPLDPTVFPAVVDQVGQLGPVISLGWPIYLANRRRDHPAAVEQLVERLPDLTLELAASLSDPACLTHGDLRVDNLFFAGTDMAVVDFQFCTRASGIYDIAYLISQGLDTTVRRGHDRELVGRYLRALQSAGLTIDVDIAWDQYVRATALLVVFPLGAILGWPALGERARDLVLTLIERWVEAVVDVEATELAS
jgi:aminoglycoside/choline kinase family phosphotransferase